MLESTKRGLSPREVTLLSGWERDRRVVVTIQDVRASVGGDAATSVASQLVRKGALQRLARGRYLVRPLRFQRTPTQPSLPVVVAGFLVDRAYYLGGRWALSFHHLTQQSYAYVVDAFVTTTLAGRAIAGGHVRFHRVSTSAMDYGIERTVVEGLQIRISDKERTILDALDRPRVFDGQAEAVRRLASHLTRLDPATLVAYAAKGSKRSTCQRLGFLLERSGVSPRKLSPLLRRVRSSLSLLSLIPDAPRTGRVDARWSVVENDR